MLDRRTRFSLCAFYVAWFVLVGCNDSDSNGQAANGQAANGQAANGQAANGQAGVDGGLHVSDAGSSGAAAGAAGGVMPEDDESWPAPGPDCGPAGQDCAEANGCGSGTLCMVGIDLCLPRRPAGLLCVPGSCEQEAPYCVAQQCMTAEEAACVCAADAAKERASACAAGPTVALGSCLSAGAFCDANPTNCCEGLTCMQGEDFLGQCQQTCTQHSECASGCCTSLGAGDQNICAPAAACSSNEAQCVAEIGAPCGLDHGPCCEGANCIRWGDQQASCAPLCTTSSECQTQCCIPVADADYSVCIDNDGMPC